LIREANVTVMVGDMKKAVAFYTETLGLTLKARYGNEFAQVQAPGTIIALHPASKERQRPMGSTGMSIGFSVQNLEKTMSDLKSKGVQFSRVVDDRQVRLAFFTDPDGNELYLSQSKWG